jgi:hypothetical protein
MTKRIDNKESLERLKNQMIQAELDGNPKLAKQIKAIIERIKAYERRDKK